MYECNIITNSQGGGFTIFKGNTGSFVDCIGDVSEEEDQINLRHSRFNQSLQTISCNNATINIQRLSDKNGTYVYSSHLNITVTSQLIGDTIECSHDDGTGTILVGESTIYDEGAAYTN